MKIPPKNKEKLKKPTLSQRMSHVEKNQKEVKATFDQVFQRLNYLEDFVHELETGLEITKSLRGTLEMRVEDLEEAVIQELSEPVSPPKEMGWLDFFFGKRR